LATWLDEHQDRYRRLVLPDPGGWTRIGYTVRLAFPSRRDQRVLRDRLNDAGLMMEEPPVGLVLAAVSGARATGFSERFRGEIDSFRDKRSAGVPLSELFSSPFWSAVCASTAEPLTDSKHAVRWTLLLSDDGYEIDVILACDTAPTEGPLTSCPLDEPIGH